MSLDRRFVLKGLAAVGFAMTSLRHAHAGDGPSFTGAAGMPPDPAGPAVTPVIGGSALDSEFLLGVQVAAQERGLTQNDVLRMRGLDAADFDRLAHLLHAGETATLVGLVDDATAALILDLVRTAGGRVISTGHHRIASDMKAGLIAKALGRALLSQPDTTAKVADTNAADTSYVSFCCVI